ncbi:heme-binding protein [Novosphingobium sp. ERN07]|uniref:GlcG/HbpS family heme-binding protein n=1 Tax=Novosphingobium sp. ERN07 TaxID=2726187 RepID=UPI001456D692|nr:heme-binding protein [Novosphingobium sp. ERN07]NLR70295.1 heme-binding protein [Novosphingobium sp. ERN07]
MSISLTWSAPAHGVMFVLSALHAGPAAAQQGLYYGEPLTLKAAQKLARLAREEAQARGLAMAVAVAGPSGDPILLEVMDRTQYASTAIAPAKARTAARFRKPTKVLQDATATGALAYVGADGALALEGGVPVIVAGNIVGALGISGGTSTQDGEVAAAALKQFKP